MVVITRLSVCLLYLNYTPRFCIFDHDSGDIIRKGRLIHSVNRGMKQIFPVIYFPFFSCIPYNPPNPEYWNISPAFPFAIDFYIKNKSRSRQFLNSNQMNAKDKYFQFIFFFFVTIRVFILSSSIMLTHV